MITHICINNSHWQSSITNICFANKFYWNFYFRYTGRLFLGCAIFVAKFNFIRAFLHTEGIKIELQKKFTQKNLCAGYPFFDCTPLIFCCSFHLLPPFPMCRTGWMPPMKIYNIDMGGILCDIENMRISCNLILAG